MLQTEPSYNSESKRLKRIETMLYLLCLHVGLDPRTGKRLKDLAEPFEYDARADR